MRAFYPNTLIGLFLYPTDDSLLFGEETDETLSALLTADMQLVVVANMHDFYPRKEELGAIEIDACEAPRMDVFIKDYL